MTFASPWALGLLLLLPVVAWRMRRPGKAGSATLIYSDLKLLGPRPGGLRAGLVRIWPWVKLVVLALLIVALARPKLPAGIKEVGGAGIDIMLVFDISGSMQAEDFKPKNRFIVAREVLREFISQAGANRLGLVVFAGKAFTQSPLAADHKIVSELLERVHIGMLEDGTAIGMAIATAANRLQASSARSKVIVLLTDGVNNRGEIDPLTAAQAAAALGIRIYAIGVGKEGGAPVPVPDPIFGQRYLRDKSGKVILTEIDEEALRQVAEVSNGAYFRATDADTLRQILVKIDTLEKNEHTLRRERLYREQCGRYLSWALALLAVQILSGATWLRKAP